MQFPFAPFQRHTLLFTWDTNLSIRANKTCLETLLSSPANIEYSILVFSSLGKLSLILDSTKNIYTRYCYGWLEHAALKKSSATIHHIGNYFHSRTIYLSTTPKSLINLTPIWSKVLTRKKDLLVDWTSDFFLGITPNHTREKVKYVSFVGKAVNSAMDGYYNKIEMVHAHNTKVFLGLDLWMNMV